MMSMVSQARRNPNIYEDLRSLGYADEEFPDWWYSPARSTEMKKDEPKIKKDETGTETIDEDVLTPPGPKTPVDTSPIEEGPGRPQLRDPIQSDPSPSSEILSDPETSPESFTQAEIDLLGSNKIVRGQDGIWVHIEKEPSGRTIIARER